MYQIRAIDEVSERFDHEGRRKFILEMATGTGKMLLCPALIRRFYASPNAERVLFIVDRIELAKLNLMQPGLAVTITSRIPDASVFAKDFRDGKRSERVAVSVDMLSTGYNCRDLLNVALMRPIFLPTEYIQIKGRGTRRFTFRIGNSEYDKKCFYLLDFCGVAEYFEETYNYSLPLPVPKDDRGIVAPVSSPASTGVFSRAREHAMPGGILSPSRAMSSSMPCPAPTADSARLATSFR